MGYQLQVVPHAGTWIEITLYFCNTDRYRVVPHAGTWIEIRLCFIDKKKFLKSFPTRERGLKYHFIGLQT